MNKTFLSLSAAILALSLPFLACSGSGGTVVDTNVGVTGVVLNKNSLLIKPGSFGNLTATLQPSNATNKGVTWASSDTSVVTVNPGDGLNCTVKAVKYGGETTVTATALDGGWSASCSVVGGLYFTTPSYLPLKLEVGEKKTLETNLSLLTIDLSQYVKWYSDDTRIATVDGGIVTGVGIGKTTVGVTTLDGELSASYSVDVVSPLSQSTLFVTLGKPRKLDITSNNYGVAWHSHDTGIATVDGGIVTGVAVGETTVTVTALYSGLTSCS
jgi:uncharacterized protein YjdB